MMLEGEAYSRRLESFSDATMQLILDVDSMNKTNAIESNRITADSELTEEEVVEKLKELQARSSR